MRLMRPFVATFLFFLLSGCSYLGWKTPSILQHRNQEYLAATSIPPLKIPPGVKSEAFKNYYPVPEHSYSRGLLKASTTPPGL